LAALTGFLLESESSGMPKGDGCKMKCLSAQSGPTLRRGLAVAFTAFVACLGGFAHGEDPVAVLITGPLAGKTGERVTFEVELVNRSGRPLQQLRVVDYFDAGFHHEASKSPIEQKGTVDLAAGTSRRLTLDFLLDEPGRQCHRVEILDQAHTFVGGATACVQVTGLPIAAAAPATPPPPIAAAATAPPIPTTPAVPAMPAFELDLTGPNDLIAGGVAEYVATIRNTGTVATPETTLDVSWDEMFSPLEASDGHTVGTAKVSWVLPPIQPGSQLRRQVNLRGQSPPLSYRGSPPTRSCVRAVLGGSGGGMMVADESCVPIHSNAPRPRSPREAGIRMSLADLDDPVAVGGATTLVCTVANGGAGPTGRLDVVIVLPDQARLVGDPIPSRVRIDGSTIAFDGIAPLPPGGQATFEVTYRLAAGGNGKATALVTGADLDGSLETNCQTTFAVP
jgi:hypothetical protein